MLQASCLAKVLDLPKKEVMLTQCEAMMPPHETTRTGDLEIYIPMTVASGT